MTTKRTTKAQDTKLDRMQRAQKKKFWPDLEIATWDRHTAVGFTTIPRCLSHVVQIMDSLSKGKPPGSTYFTLWCWTRDAQVLHIRSPMELAFESGFTGQRAESTWRERMRILRDLGFINNVEGPHGEFSYVIILDPIEVIKKLHGENKIQADRYNAHYTRLLDVGSEQLEE